MVLRVMRSAISKVDFALLHASNGFPVFPCVPNGKTPAIRNWQNWATCDEHEVRDAWEAAPDNNIGIFTGRSLLAVDVDVKAGKAGDQSLLEIELNGFELP